MKKGRVILNKKQLNLLLLPEIKDLFSFLNELYQLGADAFIVQDLGTAVNIRKLFPNIELHSSTQMTIHDLDGVKFLEELAFKRVVLSRGMSLEEIEKAAEICHENNTELFVALPRIDVNYKNKNI